MIKGAVFDVDGTLLDSMEIWKSLPAKYLKSKGMTAKENLNDRLYKMSLEEGAKFLKDNYLPNLSEGEICDGFTQMLKDFYVAEARSKKGAGQLLEYLRQNGIKMAVATAGVKEYAEIALKREGLLDYFEKIFTCTQVGRGKDCPLIYQRAADFLKTAPSETLVFEDAPYAVKTARDAGFITVGVFDSVNPSAFEQLKKTASRAVYQLCDFRLF